ncbi:MAG: SDR family oxidoreductase [Pseudomonadota bacterium]
MPSAFFIGLGYSARPLAERLIKEGWDVTGTTRSEEKAAALKARGIHPLLWEAGQPLSARNVFGHDAVIISVAPKEGACPAATALKEGKTDKATARVLYLSSSGVYGDYDGAWIDETAECRPSTDRGIARLAAENQWRDLASRVGANLTLCRLAGIYGPGRSAIDSLSGDTPGARAGLTRRLIKPGQVFNRIHRDDIATGLHALLTTDDPIDIVNFSDDEPGPPADVITYAAELLCIAPPPEVRFEDIKDELSPMAQSFYAENKRLKNERLKALVGQLQHPNYRHGLEAIAAMRAR